jgi:RNA polymerase primary sigma factor
MADSIKDYLNSIAKYPLLTAEQEIQLGRRVVKWRELKDLTRSLTPNEKRELRSGERARQRFIQSNLQLVVHVARKYDRRQNKTLELMDLIQEGNIGLARAVELFDPSRGYKFSTYAYWWIRQGITRALIMQDAMIRLPSSLHELLFKINRTAQDMGHRLGREPTLSELAEAIAMDTKELSMMLKRAYRVTSLDQKINDADSGSICDTIADPSCLEDDVTKSQEIAQMMKYFAKYLDSTTQQVMQARSLAVPVTWSALEKQLGMNKTKLQNLERRGINRLRMLMSNPLDDTPLGHVAANDSQSGGHLSSVPKWYV